MASRKSAASTAPDRPAVTRSRLKAQTSKVVQPPEVIDMATVALETAPLAAPPTTLKSDRPAKPVRGRKGLTKPAVLPPDLTDMSPLADTPDMAPQPTRKRPRPSARVVAVEVAKAAEPQGLRVFQAFQESWQRELLDPDFAALDQSRQASDLPELTLPQALLNHKATQSVQYWGVVSWRFVQQTGLTGQDLRLAIEQHPNADVYVANPAVADEGLFHNAWLQGETEHPGLIALAAALFQASGLPAEALSSVHPLRSHGDATVLVANQAFWSAYVTFIQKLVSHSKDLDAGQRAKLLSRFNDESALFGSTTMLGAIVRKLLPVFLKTEGKRFKLHKLSLPEKERGLNVHEQLLREMKDVAHNTQSTWLAACWVNYRNLYLHQSRGKAWCQKHLREITPVDIRFG